MRGEGNNGVYRPPAYGSACFQDGKQEINLERPNDDFSCLLTVHESLSGPGMSSTIQVIVNSELRRELQVARSVRLKVSATLTYTGGDDFL